MDSQRTVDHLRDEANARKDTTLGDLLDTAAEELDEAEHWLEQFSADDQAAITNAIIDAKRQCKLETAAQLVSLSKKLEQIIKS